MTDWLNGIAAVDGWLFSCCLEKNITEQMTAAATAIAAVKNKRIMLMTLYEKIEMKQQDVEVKCHLSSFFFILFLNAFFLILF